MFVGQAIENLDAYQQQVTYSKTAPIGKTSKRKEKDGGKPAHPDVQMHFSEEKDSLLFVTMFPKVEKLEAQMRPSDYTLHVVGVNLLNAMISNKVEMMKETLKDVSLDFIKKSPHLEKVQAENVTLRESLDQ